MDNRIGSILVDHRLAPLNRSAAEVEADCVVPADTPCRPPFGPRRLPLWQTVTTQLSTCFEFKGLNRNEEENQNREWLCVQF